jgi:hypothetical protein
MGYNARNDEIRDNVTRMRREWEAQRGARLDLGPTSKTAMVESKPRDRLKMSDEEHIRRMQLAVMECMSNRETREVSKF